jgi:hypothetical protein
LKPRRLSFFPTYTLPQDTPIPFWYTLSFIQPLKVRRMCSRGIYAHTNKFHVRRSQFRCGCVVSTSFCHNQFCRSYTEAMYFSCLHHSYLHSLYVYNKCFILNVTFILQIFVL